LKGCQSGSQKNISKEVRTQQNVDFAGFFLWGIVKTFHFSQKSGEQTGELIQATRIPFTGFRPKPRPASFVTHFSSKNLPGFKPKIVVCG
jgi:hypothetical protein